MLRNSQLTAELLCRVTRKGVGEGKRFCFDFTRWCRTAVKKLNFVTRHFISNFLFTRKSYRNVTTIATINSC